MSARLALYGALVPAEHYEKLKRLASMAFLQTASEISDADARRAALRAAVVALSEMLRSLRMQGARASNDNEVISIDAFRQELKL